MTTAECWKRIEALFEQALDLPASQRASFLNEQCAGDEPLRNRLDSLLDEDSRAQADFLERPAIGPRLTFRADAPDPLVGQTLGAYTIKRTIAHGGMGTVYLAEQANPRREVALKVLHKSLWTQFADRRFDFEAQILARLQHPHIAQIFEAGSAVPGDSAASPVPHAVRYFAMEYVPNAATITSFAEQAKLDIPRRLELFLQVAEAVQYGHQKGVIHRDLKPANILVAHDTRVSKPACPEPGRRVEGPAIPGTVKVIDFGVARAIDGDVALTTMHTETGQLIGTLAYMSPEQCDADPLGLDVRSDVYSLGVVLYELICDRLPYEVSKTSIVSAAKTIKEALPLRPSAITGSGRRPSGRTWRDLETVILKSLEKDRDKRYSSVADLARDIRHWLKREPIEARPPTPWTQIARWITRHPVRTTLIGCAAVATITVAMTATAVYWLAVRPHRLELAPDRSSARLVTWNSYPLHEWNGKHEAVVSFAELIQQPGVFGARRLAVLGFANESAMFPGTLCAFDVDGDWENPVWSRSVADNESIPPDAARRGPAGKGFFPAYALVADIFPDKQSPGPEIVTVFSHYWSHRLLRIYNLNGDSHFQVWQDGGMVKPYWMSKPGLLVLSSLDEAEKAQNGATYSPLILAIKPNSNDMRGGDPAESELSIACIPVWHRYILPPVRPGAGYSCTLSSETGGLPADCHVAVEFCFWSADDKPTAASFRVILDQTGNEVPESRRPGDEYPRLKSKLRLRDPQDFVFSAKPPSRANWPGKPGAATSIVPQTNPGP